ncbi:hypothetical protein M885DRAFT_552708 [Pelagophyceae sp. CCMP2097]|nr:hypothetical protein M885DRAFT_552708 [Pelagophyceae sp. CCMP2097]
MGRRVAAVLACAAGLGSDALQPLGRQSSSARQLTVAHQYAPQGSGYVMKDEDDAGEMRFSEFPDTYEPDLTYPGTCKPGLGRENRPMNELSLDKSLIAPHAFFEAPFHVRMPPNHPWVLSPYERLELAGRFSDEGAAGDRGGDRRGAAADRDMTSKMTVEKFDRSADANGPEADAVESDPLFDDESSTLLDAALGLGDDGTKGGSGAGARAEDEDFLLD